MLVLRPSVDDAIELVLKIVQGVRADRVLRPRIGSYGESAGVTRDVKRSLGLVSAPERMQAIVVAKEDIGLDLLRGGNPDQCHRSAKRLIRRPPRRRLRE